MVGYEAQVNEVAGITDAKHELTEERKEELDGRLRWVGEHIAELPEITIVYFQEDTRKEGGAYVSTTGRVKRIDLIRGELKLTDERIIRIEDIFRISLSK